MIVLEERLRKHVLERGGPEITNGAWKMMLEAADEIESLRAMVESKDLEIRDLYYDLAGEDL